MTLAGPQEPGSKFNGWTECFNVSNCNRDVPQTIRDDRSLRHLETGCRKSLEDKLRGNVKTRMSSRRPTGALRETNFGTMDMNLGFNTIQRNFWRMEDDRIKSTPRKILVTS